MTYPQRPPEPYDQRPGGPWAAQPGPQGVSQQSPYGQQSPGYPPQSGGYGQPQQPAGYGPPPGYGQPPGGFPPPPGYGQPPGGFPPPRKSNTGLIIGIVIAAVVVLGGGGVGAYFLFSGHKSTAHEAAGTSTAAGSTPAAVGDNPDSLAQRAVTALNTRNLSELIAVSCDKTPPPTADQDMQNLQQANAVFTVAGKAQLSGDTATAAVHLDATHNGVPASNDGHLIMKGQNGTWCVDDVQWSR